MRTPSNLAYHELIGLPVKVIDLKTSLLMASGRVVWETKNTFTIVSGEGKRLKIPKRNKSFVFKLGENDVEIKGDSIVFRPEDRTGRMDP
jgi:RNase P/RNase MRP subunit p29